MITFVTNTNDMKVTVYPVRGINAECSIPSSKSHAQRVLALALFNPNKTEIIGIGQSDDEQVLLKIADKLAYRVDQYGEVTSIEGIRDISSLTRPLEISTGESGLATRMLTPMLANFHADIIITGKGSLLTRPMDFFDAVLPHLGVQVTSNNKKLPLHIKGPLQPKSYQLDGSQSSQYITGLLYAYATSPLLRECTLQLENVTSRPYIDLSIATLRQFGITISFQDDTLFFTSPAQLSPTTVKIEGDWSSASFFIVAAALNGKVTLSNLSKESKQADKAILSVIRDFGATVTINENLISIEKGNNKGFEFDATHCPDLFPPLAVLAASADSVCKIKGLGRLASKESDRATALQIEMGKLGIRIDTDHENDTMLIYPGIASGGTVSAHNDHRIAMALSVLALSASSPVTISEAESVNKSFAEFYDLLSETGVRIEKAP